jgi:hypothetical protein
VGLKIICSGFLIRYPAGGFTWHHLQYLIGLSRLGHDVSYLEDYGWTNSCYDSDRNIMTADPTNGIAYFNRFCEAYDIRVSWCYLAEDGTAYGMSRQELKELCRRSDLYLDLSNVNWIPELAECRRRVLVDTDPVFTQIDGHGLGGFDRYQVLFTFGENVHQRGCDMPTAGVRWLPTRQPVVLDLWPVRPGDLSKPFTTVGNWSALRARVYEGKVYGMKDREFTPFFSLPKTIGESMEMALNAPDDVKQRLAEGGWHVVDGRMVAFDPATYQKYLRNSRGEFTVAKHGYVVTRCGWFSERTACYLASGRPVIAQDTGFSQWLQSEFGVIAFKTPEQAIDGIREVNRRYELHCAEARRVAEMYFDARTVLSLLVEQAL